LKYAKTVTTALLISSPTKASAVSYIFLSTIMCDRGLSLLFDA